MIDGARSGVAGDSGRRTYRGGDRRIQLPAHRFFIAAAGGAVAGGKPRDLEQRVSLQQLDEALTDGAGSAKNANPQSLCHWPLRCLLGFDNFIANRGEAANQVLRSGIK